MCRNKRGDHRTLSKNSGPNLDFEFVKANFWHRSLIVKSQLNRIVLVTRPAASQDKYTCPQCGKKFWQNSTLRDHVDFVHKGLKKYQCQQCGRAFETKARLKGHCDATGNCAQVKEKIFQCPKCQKAFLKQDGLAKHSAKCLGVAPLKVEYNN